MANLQNLTTAEQRIGDLLQQGLSNKAIAQHLVISIRTVESHILPLPKQGPPAVFNL